MPAGDGARRMRALGRRLRGDVTDRLAYKAAALILAVVLWLVVTTSESAEQVVPVRFSPVLERGTTLAGPPPAIQALVVGRTREILKLYASPPRIRRAFDAETPESVRVQLRPADVDLPPGVEAVVRGVQPPVLTLRFATRVATGDADAGR